MQCTLTLKSAKIQPGKTETSRSLLFIVCLWLFSHFARMLTPHCNQEKKES